MAVQENVEECWVRVGGPSETTVQIWGSRLPQLDSYGFGDFAVIIHGDGLNAHGIVRTVEQGTHSIRAFFRDHCVWGAPEDEDRFDRVCAVLSPGRDVATARRSHIRDAQHVATAIRTAPTRL